MKTTIALALCAAIALPLAAPLAAQEDVPAAEETALQEELRLLNQTMREIAVLLEQNLEKQEVDFYLKRLDLGMQKIAPVERELRSTRAQRDSVDDEHKQLTAVLEGLDEEIAGQDAAPLDDSASENVARMRKDLERQLRFLKDKSWDLEQKILELENELARRREDVRILEEWIDERLGLR